MNTRTANRQGRKSFGFRKRRTGQQTPAASTTRTRNRKTYKPTGNTARRDRPARHRSFGHTNKRRIPTFDPTAFINKQPQRDTLEDEVYVAKNTFESFGLCKTLVHLLKEKGIVTPSPIQDQIIPHIMQGRDVIGLAETGTGKTAAFLLPLIERTIANKGSKTLILTPTRELAGQIEKELHDYTKKQNIFGTLCVGGVGIMPQIRALKRQNHFIIGTPGRIGDLIDRGNIRPSEFTTVVLDEADRMLDMGFIHDMRKILSKTRKDRETLLFSATMSPATQEISKEFLSNPAIVSVKKRDVTNSIEQDVVRYANEKKYDVLMSLLARKDMTRVIVFGAMKHGVEKLAKQLHASGITVESIQGNKTHGQRQRALSRFKNGDVRVLVATDVAARGIHVDDVSHVINYDLPTSFEDYVHRIGRTGRGEKSGIALTLVPQRA